MRDDARSKAGAGDRATASVVMSAHGRSRARARGRYKVECFPPMRDSFGNIIYKDEKRRGLLGFLKHPLVLAGVLANVRIPIPDFDHPKWVECIDNIVVTEGLNIIGDSTLRGGTRYTAWYLLLKGTGTPLAADTMASHGSWSEITPYSNSVRPTWTPGSMSSGSVDNSASVAVFNINGTSTIYGCGLSSDSTKGGTSGKLYSAGDFASSRAVVSGDTVNVTYTGSYADDGV